VLPYVNSVFEQAMRPNSQTNYPSTLLIRTLLLCTEDRPRRVRMRT